MEMEVRLTERILREHICGLCAECTREGTCGLDKPSSCPVNARLPILAVAIQAKNKTTLQDVRAAVRDALCDACPSTSADGGCRLTDEVPSQMVIEAQLRPMRLVATIKQTDPHAAQQQVALALDNAITVLLDAPLE